MPKAGQTRTENFKISFTAMDAAGISYDVAKKLTASYLKKHLAKMVLEKVGGKLIPGIGWASDIADALAIIAQFAGYSGIIVHVKLKYISKYNGQIGEKIEGWDVTGISIGLYK